ncbi:MAG: hypothetical protein MUF71_21710, partial [Candidatus Kapabacteria bacterium]|nr:hypothetical protein [Candidatus Kapabacteria bacterium]
NNDGILPQALRIFVVSLPSLSLSGFGCKPLRKKLVISKFCLFVIFDRVSENEHKMFESEQILIPKMPQKPHTN